ncbi:MAG: hypothetical protein AB7S26_38510 [Sandaracinaceae bacterium]
MPSRCVWTGLAVALACACDGAGCPDGSVAALDRCVRPDGAPPRDAGDRDAVSDAGNTDAGSCGACSSPTPVCDESTGDCVECLAENDCASNTAEPHCDTINHVCVACRDRDDCTDPMTPVCDAHACRACGLDSECTARTATPVCDEPSGRCVECTVDTEMTTCPAPDNFACHPTDFTCTGAERGSLGFCNACVSDSECLTDSMGALRCVPMTFGMPAAAHGTYCLLDLASYRTATGMPAAPCPDTMASSHTARSVGDVETEYCFVREAITSCEAVLGFGNLCPGGNGDCGATGLDDASCQGGRCSYECSGPSDCTSGMCVGGGPRYCQ